MNLNQNVCRPQSQSNLSGPLARYFASSDTLPGLADGNQGRVVLFGVGEPVFARGTLLGGLGVSGGTVDEDCDILHYAMTTVMGEL